MGQSSPTSPTSTSASPRNPDEKIAWAKEMLADEHARHELCDREFLLADEDKSGTLQLEEVVSVIFKICKEMDINLPSKQKVTELVKVVQHTEKDTPAAEIKDMSPFQFRIAINTVLKSIVNQAEKQAVLLKNLHEAVDAEEIPVLESAIKAAKKGHVDKQDIATAEELLEGLTAKRGKFLEVHDRAENGEDLAVPENAIQGAKDGNEPTQPTPTHDGQRREVVDDSAAVPCDQDALDTSALHDVAFNFKPSVGTWLILPSALGNEDSPAVSPTAEALKSPAQSLQLSSGDVPTTPKQSSQESIGTTRSPVSQASAGSTGSVFKSWKPSRPAATQLETVSNVRSPNEKEEKCKQKEERVNACHEESSASKPTPAPAPQQRQSVPAAAAATASQPPKNTSAEHAPILSQSMKNTVRKENVVPTSQPERNAPIAQVKLNLCRFKVQVPEPYPGIQYRISKNPNHRHERYAEKGAIVLGCVEDDGMWLRVADNLFLPIRLNTPQGEQKLLEPLVEPPEKPEEDQELATNIKVSNWWFTWCSGCRELQPCEPTSEDVFVQRVDGNAPMGISFSDTYP